jgi:hypothetical protein
MYGAELWYKVSEDDLLKLERAHRFCLKIIQGLPKRTSTVIVQSMVDMFSIEKYIDLRKLVFVGRLCRLDCGKLAKQMFVERLYQEKFSPKPGTGFVNDIVRILEKYRLMYYLDEFTSTFSFPGKIQWKYIVQSQMKLHEENQLNVSSQDYKFNRYFLSHGLSVNVHPIWLLEHKAKGHRKHIRDLAKLNGVLCNRGADKACVYCQKSFNDHIDHYFHSCNKYAATRELFWCLIVNTCNIELGAYLYNLPDPSLSCVILGQKPDVPITNIEAAHLLTLCATTWQILAHERELPFY